MRYKDVAFKAARRAGDVLLGYFDSEFKVEKKSTDFDLVTQADLESEEAVVDTIRSAYPGHNILAEENEYARTSSEYTWIIDPLDGTNNFACKLPFFCVSIALACRNELLLGLIYDPMRKEAFFAEKGKGAFLNDRPVTVSRRETLQGSLLITGFYYDRGNHMKDTLTNIERFFGTGILGIRRLGSAALDLCYVASGRATGFWEFCLSPWDYAAGKLIVEEAGGRVSDKAGGPVDFYRRSYIVASNALIHDQMISILV